jgi:hypothetical protein
MKVALMGFPLSGRTTLFDALSGGHARDGIASIPIPDPRFEALARQAGAKKITPAAFEWRDDLPDFNPDKPETARQPLSLARPERRAGVRAARVRQPLRALPRAD